VRRVANCYTPFTLLFTFTVLACGSVEAGPTAAAAGSRMTRRRVVATLARHRAVVAVVARVTRPVAQRTCPAETTPAAAASAASTCTHVTRSSAIAEGPRDASCQLKSCQLTRNSAETTSLEPSISGRYLSRATKSCCRQSLTICAINYSGRASELGGIIDLVDRGRPSLSRSERPPFSS